MDPSQKLTKTAKGTLEMTERSGELSQRHRRVLLLIDGHRSVADLEPMCRPGELDEIVKALLSGGFITSSSTAQAAGAAKPVPQPAVPPAAAAPAAPVTPAALDDPETFVRIRKMAIRELYDLMGPGADDIALKIERCQTPNDLRAELRHVEGLLSQVVGARQAQQFAAKVGKSLM